MSVVVDGIPNGKSNLNSSNESSMEHRETTKVLLLSLAILFATASIQLLVAIVSSSVALMADAVHNFADAFTSLPLLLAFRLSRHRPTQRFSYGLKRSEDLAGLFIVIVIAASGFAAGYIAIERIVRDVVPHHLWIAALTAILAFLSNEVVAYLRIRLGRKIGSAALVADGRHALIDGWTSLSVLVGLIATKLGYPFVDPIVGLLLTAVVFFVVKESSQSVLIRLLDGIEPGTADCVVKSALQVDGVEEVTNVRARWLGHTIHTALDISVNEVLSVRQGNDIASNVERKLMVDIPHLTSVHVHVNPFVMAVLNSDCEYERRLDGMYRELLHVVDENHIKLNEPLAAHTFPKVGGKADIVVFPTDLLQVQRIISFAGKEKIPYFVMGNGSNLIVRDGGVRGIVIVLTQVTQMWHENNRIVVEAGVSTAELAQYALSQHLTGLEFACGIPGTVGGAIAMNASAFEGQISDVVERVTVCMPDGRLQILEKEDLQLGYRDSAVRRNGWAVLTAAFRLRPGNIDEIKAQMDEFTNRRALMQPLDYPSCGSVFKRPQNDYAGRLIQDCDLQGTRVGDAEVSRKHAGFIINLGSATAADYIQLIHHVQATVHEKCGVDLETEVEIIGDEINL